MKQIQHIMGMPVTVELVDKKATISDVESVFLYFQYVDQKFSTYIESSEIQQINSGILALSDASSEMQEIFKKAEVTKRNTNGYFDIKRNGVYDPSGIVKGWAIWNAALMLFKRGFRNFYINAGGDIQSFGVNEKGLPWTIGIRNPFETNQIVKVIKPRSHGVATSGTYERGNHIYDPKGNFKSQESIVSLTVIAPTIYEADLLATAAFAMGKKGIYFLEEKDGVEGYMIDKEGLATMTSGFEDFVSHETD